MPSLLKRAHLTLEDLGLYCIGDLVEATGELQPTDRFDTIASGKGLSVEIKFLEGEKTILVVLEEKFKTRDEAQNAAYPLSFDIRDYFGTWQVFTTIVLSGQTDDEIIEEMKVKLGAHIGKYGKESNLILIPDIAGFLRRNLDNSIFEITVRNQGHLAIWIQDLVQSGTKSLIDVYRWDFKEDLCGFAIFGHPNILTIKFQNPEQQLDPYRGQYQWYDNADDLCDYSQPICYRVENYALTAKREDLLEAIQGICEEMKKTFPQIQQALNPVID